MSEQILGMLESYPLVRFIKNEIKEIVAISIES